MASFGSTIGAMGFNITNGFLSQTLSVQLNNLEHMLIHGRHKGVRFYYDSESGGSVQKVLAKTLVNGAISELGSLAKNTFKDLLWKDGKYEKPTEGWAFERMKAIMKEKEKKYGVFPVNNDKDVILAIDHQGYRVRDALMLGIKLPDDKKIPFSQTYRNEDLISDFRTAEEKELVYRENNISECDHLVWFDTSAIVNVESSKNLVVTQVQGRDYSRKELISNGDLNISVSGYITSPYPDVYPIEEVTKLRQILRYKGIVEVNNIILDGWDVNKIVIKDFNFPQDQGSKSVQRYSFSAVAVQPEMLSEVDEDTIKIIQQPFDTVVTEDNKWLDMLNTQLNRLKQAAGSLADVGITKGSELANEMLDKSL